MEIRAIFSVAPMRRLKAQLFWSSDPINALNRWRSAYKAWRREQAATFELASLSDRDLKDIGLNRCEIARAVRFRPRCRAEVPTDAAAATISSSDTISNCVTLMCGESARAGGIQRDA
jgi:uncharacterized protein YjiS (DUF1127 family)